MKLKQIEIIGFKSFHERTLLNFDKDVIAIVGPNGAGKSNVVDAIRWVMGEQSAKHLRGKSMEDVIFAGSSTRPPVSMARVELVFSTEGYQTPASYLNHSEISIARSLYRTGESEYFINKVPVRLKDITDLFLGTGIGTKAYSVIEQGKVGQIVTSRPEERRFYIEEVAGTSRFKARKEAALRRMEATQQNLLRLTDLVSELERQMKSLDRQARKAEKYRELKKEYEAIDLAVLSAQVAEGLKRQEGLEKEMARLSEEEASSRAALAGGENTVEEKRTLLSDEDRKIQDCQNELFDADNRVTLGETSLRFKKDESAELLRQWEHLQSERDEFSVQIEGVGNGATQVEEKLFEATLEEEVVAESVAELEKSHRDEAKRLEESAGTAESLRAELRLREARLQEIRNLLSSKRDRKGELSGQASELDADLEESREKFAKFESFYAETAASLSQLGQLKLALHGKTDQVALELSSYREKLREQEQSLLQLKELAALRKSRLKSLEELERNFEGYQEGTRSILLKKKESGAEGILGAVADFIETEPEYEAPVSAVLGDKLQYVVVKSHQEGMEGVEYLRTASLGRSSFVPLEIRSHGSDTDELRAEGVVGPLRKFVNLRGEHEHLAEFLFGDVVLVRDLSAALRIWNANGHKKRLVTMNGEVVDPSGVITGGSLAGTAKAILEKKREIKALMGEVTTLEAELAEKEMATRLLGERVFGMEKTLDELRTSSVEEEFRIANQEKELAQFKLERDHVTVQQNAITERLQEIAAQLGVLTEETVLFEKEAAELTRSVEEATRRLGEVEGALNEIRSGSEEASQRITSLKIESAKSRERKTHLHSELERLISEKERIKFAIADRERRMEIITGRREFLEREMAHIQRVLGKKRGIRETLAGRMEGFRKIFDTLSSEIHEAEAALRDGRKRLEEATASLNRTTLELTEVRGRLRSFSEQGLERHQRDLARDYASFLQENLDLEGAQEKAHELKEALSRLGEVNTLALTEYEELKTRFEFLAKQKEDLAASLASLERVIQKINRTTKERFLEAFNLINEKFQTLFPKLFGGGRAQLLLTDENNLLETGVEIVAQPPGKKNQTITLLSGGEKALTAISLIFAIFQIKPSPFCILDEVDAPLDDANVGRYNDLIREMTPRTQFIVITHNKQTMQTTDVLYGITMQEPGVSQVISVNLVN